MRNSDKALFNSLQEGNFEKADSILASNGYCIDEMDYAHDVGYDDIDMRTDTINYLVEAFKGYRLDIAEYLLERGANFRMVADKVFSDLKNANQEYAFQSFKLLIRYQGNILIHLNTDQTGENFLTYLADKIIISAPVGTWNDAPTFTPLKNKNDFTPKEMLRFNYSLEQLNDLFSGLVFDAISINRKNPAGDTPVMKAIKNNHASLVRWLMATGKVDLSIKDRNGRTAIDLAELADPELRQAVIPQRKSDAVLSDNTATLFAQAGGRADNVWSPARFKNSRVG